MDIIKLVENLSVDMYQRLLHAVETGKWPEGTPVNEEQIASAMQIVMAYQAKNLNSDQMLTIGSDGQIINKTKRELKEQFSNSSSNNNNDNNIARFSDI